MARSDDRSDELDREAILARRQRAIALALAGLSATSACARAQPCLSVAPTEPFNGADDGDAAEDSFDDVAVPNGDADAEPAERDVPN